MTLSAGCFKRGGGRAGESMESGESKESIMGKIVKRNAVKRARRVSFEFTGRGVGAMRSTGEIILMLLTFEDEPLRADVLACAARDMGISLEELTKAYAEAGE